MYKTSLGLKIEEPTQEILESFKAVEGNNYLYFGRVRNGKTYSATADIIDLLKRGEIVYANWDIKFDDYDERTSLLAVFMKFVAGKRHFYKFSKKNFHYFRPDDVDPIFLGKLVSVHVFIDEGQWLFNSHIRDRAEDEYAVAKRKLILHGGHYCRSLSVITQRPMNVFPDIRSQIAIWYHCEKKFQLGRFIIFSRSEIQDMKNNEPDLEAVLRTKVYFGRRSIYEAYNTHAMRDDDAIESVPDFEVFQLNFWDRLRLLISFLPFASRIMRERKVEPFMVNRKISNKDYPRTLKGFVWYLLGREWVSPSLVENSVFSKSETGLRSDLGWKIRDIGINEEVRRAKP